jgi:hypothetical protein
VVEEPEEQPSLVNSMHNNNVNKKIATTKTLALRKFTKSNQFTSIFLETPKPVMLTN